MNRILTFLIYGIFLISCREIVEVDLPEIEMKPVVNCLFSPDSPFKVHVSLPMSPTDTATYNVVNAEVTISSEGSVIARLAYAGSGLYSNSNLVPAKGVIYTLKVTVPGFDEVAVSDNIPASGAKILSVVSKGGYKAEEEEGKIPIQRLKLTISNDQGISDFMGVAIVQNHVSYTITNDGEIITESEEEYHLGYLYSDDPAITTEGLNNYEPPLFLFKDELFQSQTAHVELLFEKESKSRFWVRFFQFSPSAFQYIKSWIIHDYTKEYDFWEVYEPMPLFSNIENGYGIFAGYSSQLFEVYPDSTITFE